MSRIATVTFVGNNIRIQCGRIGHVRASRWLSEDVSWGSGDLCLEELLLNIFALQHSCQPSKSVT